MKHPSDAVLALYAGSDLGWAKQKITERHVRQCGACQSVVVEYSELRPGSREFPSLQWNRLASDMTANIALGLSAGECVAPRSGATMPVRLSGGFTGSWRRLGVACAVMCGLAGVAFILQHPPSLNTITPAAGAVLEASESGLQVSEGSQTLRFLNTSGSDVSRTVGARGEVDARYLDPNGYVTVSQVYGQ